MVHNGVMDSDEFTIGLNDTYEAVRVFEEEGITSKLRDKIYTSGSAWLVFDVEKEKLNIGKIGYNPLEVLFTNNSIIMASIGLKKFGGIELSDNTNHFLKLDTNSMSFKKVSEYVKESYYSRSYYSTSSKFRELEEGDRGHNRGGDYEREHKTLRAGYQYNEARNCYHCWNCGQCDDVEAYGELYSCPHCEECNLCYDAFVKDKYRLNRGYF